MKKGLNLFACLALILTVLVSLTGSVFAASDIGYKKLYKPVIDEYRILIGTKGELETPLLDQKAMFGTTYPGDTDNDGVFYFLWQGYGDCVYDLKDIDSDGIPELFIFTKADVKRTGNFGAVYTIIDGEPKLLYSCSGMGTLHYLTKDKKVVMTGYGLSESFVVSSSKYSKGTSTLEYEYEYVRDKDVYTYSDSEGNKKTLTKEEYEEAIAKIEDNYYKFNWKDLSDYSKELVEEDDTNTDDTDKPSTDKPSTDKPSTDQPSVQATVKIYRLYNTITGEHLYTSDANEASVLSAQADWNSEGIGWHAPKSGTPVYRLYSPVTGVHLFTTDTNEVNVLSHSGWSIDNNEKPLFYSGGSKNVYRLYNPVLRMHLITTDTYEYSVLAGKGWNQEGVKLNAQ